MIKKLFITAFFIVNTIGVFAQQTFRYRAALPKPDSGGFYQINLLPSLTAKSNADFSDVRVLDSHGKFIPYIFGSQLPYSGKQNFVVFPQVENPQENDSTTVFIAQNKAGLGINQLWLRLRNTSVQRTVNLSGSDDLKTWYAIREDISLEEADANKNGVYEQLINFPSSTYRYFKVQINNGTNEPVAVLQAGIYRQQLEDPDYVQLNKPTFKQADSSKISHILIRFNGPELISKLHLDLTGSRYYKRDMRIYNVKGKNRELLDDTHVSAGSPGDYYFSAKTNMLELEILNGDNPPLKLSAVSAFQLSQSVISYLEKGEQYYVLVGDEKATTPEYDLRFFTDSLQRQLPQVTHTDVAANPEYKIAGAAGESSIPSWVIWVAIIAALLVLVFLTSKMTQEVRRRAAEEKERE